VYELGQKDKRRGAVHGTAHSSLVDLCEPEEKRREERGKSCKRKKRGNGYALSVLFEGR
jgi:hypothetical protein